MSHRFRGVNSKDLHRHRLACWCLNIGASITRVSGYIGLLTKTKAPQKKTTVDDINAELHYPKKEYTIIPVV